MSYATTNLSTTSLRMATPLVMQDRWMVSRVSLYSWGGGRGVTEGRVGGEGGGDKGCHLRG